MRIISFLLATLLFSTHLVLAADKITNKDKHAIKDEGESDAHKSGDNDKGSND